MNGVPTVAVADVPTDAPLLDVREADEWDAGHAPTAQHLPMSELVERIGELPDDDPILEFVLMNAAALFVVSGLCDADASAMGPVVAERGPGGGRWKEGVRRARWAIRSGEAWRQWEAFAEATESLPEPDSS